MEKGYVYILANSSFKFLKIGFTNRDPKNRIDELDTTGVPTPFELVYEVLVWDAESLEKKIHSELGRCRVRNSREFFEISQDIAYMAVKNILKKNNIEILYEKKHKDFHLKPSGKLGNIIGDEMVTRLDAYAKFISYLKKRNLYDEEEKIYKCDIFLKTLTGKNYFSNFEISDIIDKNLEY